MTLETPPDETLLTKQSSTILYPHKPLSLLPFLGEYLPHSIPIYGLIVAALPPDLSSLEDLSPEIVEALPTIYTTFSPSQVDEPQGERWIAIARLPSPQSDQIRLFCSLETTLPSPSSSSSSSSSSTSTSSLSVSNRYQEAIAHVIEALKVYDETVESTWSVVGALNTVWEEPVRKYLGGNPRGICAVLLPPEQDWVLPSNRGAAISTNAGGANGVEKRREGFVVDQGREVDVEAFRISSDIPRKPDYYRQRLFRSTVIRPTSTSARPATVDGQGPESTWEPGEPIEDDEATPAAAAIVLTHLDGALGALHTDDAYRRKGLARWVVKVHLDSGRGVLRIPKDPPQQEMEKDGREEKGYAWTCVFHGNEASEGLFRDMGWQRKWDVAWVYKGGRNQDKTKRDFTRYKG